MQIINMPLARDINAVSRLTGAFVLRSGAISDEYFDKYMFESDPVLLSGVVGEMSHRVPFETQYLAGLEMGGIPLATVLSLWTNLPALFVRKKAKEHGTAKQIEGPDPRGCHVTLIEDVISSGGAVQEAAMVLRNAGAIVHTVICAIDRRSDMSQGSLRIHAINVRAVFTKLDLDRARNEKEH